MHLVIHSKVAEPILANPIFWEVFSELFSVVETPLSTDKSMPTPQACNRAKRIITNHKPFLIVNYLDFQLYYDIQQVNTIVPLIYYFSVSL